MRAGAVDVHGRDLQRAGAARRGAAEQPAQAHGGARRGRGPTGGHGVVAPVEARRAGACGAVSWCLVL